MDDQVTLYRQLTDALVDQLRSKKQAHDIALALNRERDLADVATRRVNHLEEMLRIAESIVQAKNETIESLRRIGDIDGDHPPTAH
jgi:hypothetical protein